MCFKPRFCNGQYIRAVQANLVSAFCTCAALLSHAPVTAQERPGIQGAAIVEFRVSAHGAPLVLPVTIGDVTYPFLIGTGSRVCAIDESLRDKLALTPAPKPAGNGALVPTFYTPPPLRLGSLDVGRPLALLLPDFRKEFAISGLDVYGIIGINALRDHIMSIDFDDGVVRFPRQASSHDGAAVPLHCEDEKFHVVAELAGGIRETFLIDTGNCGFHAVSLRTKMFDGMVGSGELALFTGRTDAAFTLTGVVPMRLGEIRGLSVARFSHGPVIVNDTIRSSTLGLGYLSRYHVTFDFPRAIMYLRPGKEYGREDVCELGGFGLARIDGKLFLAPVYPAGAAAAAGLEELDELIAVDGVSAQRASIFELCRQFTVPGRRRVKYRREGEAKETVVVLSKPRRQTLNANDNAGPRKEDKSNY